jgi:hypothetical protein
VIRDISMSRIQLFSDMASFTVLFFLLEAKKKYPGRSVSEFDHPAISSSKIVQFCHCPPLLLLRP